jgi:hypothetical protein
VMDSFIPALILGFSNLLVLEALLNRTSAVRLTQPATKVVQGN